MSDKTETTKTEPPAKTDTKASKKAEKKSEAPKKEPPAKTDDAENKTPDAVGVNLSGIEVTGRPAGATGVGRYRVLDVDAGLGEEGSVIKLANGKAGPLVAEGKICRVGEEPEEAAPAGEGELFPADQAEGGED